MFPLSKIKYLLCLLLFFLLVCCQKDDGVEVNDRPNEPFYLENLGISFGPWNPETNFAGDFYFVPEQIKLFSEFGAEVLAHDGSLKRLPHFTYYARLDAPVLAASALEVYEILFQENGADYEVFTRSVNNPFYEVLYDHLVDLQVTKGEHVSAGDTLGYPRAITPAYGFFEFMINNTKTHYSYCPFCCFNPVTRSTYEQQVIELMQDWETFKMDTSIYDEAAHVSPGCLLDSIP